MSLYCQNLGRCAPEINVVKGELLTQHGLAINSKKPNLYRFNLDDESLNHYLDVIPELRPYLMYWCITETKPLLPHIHTGPIHSIVNVYLDTADERTTFWDGKIEYDDRYVTDNGAGYWNVKPELIEPIESFVAKKGEYWMLDPMTPHSVLPDIAPEKEVIDRLTKNADLEILKVKSKHTRRIAQLLFKLSTAETLEKLNG